MFGTVARGLARSLRGRKTGLKACVFGPSGRFPRARRILAMDSTTGPAGRTRCADFEPICLYRRSHTGRSGCWGGGSARRRRAQRGGVGSAERAAGRDCRCSHSMDCRRLSGVRGTRGAPQANVPRFDSRPADLWPWQPGTDVASCCPSRGPVVPVSAAPCKLSAVCSVHVPYSRLWAGAPGKAATSVVGAQRHSP